MFGSKKTTAAAEPVIDRSVAEQAILDWARAQAELASITAQKKVALTELENRFSPKVQELEKQAADAEVTVRAYASKFPEIFNGKKSTPLAGHTIGYRLGSPKLVELEGWDETRVLTALKKHFPDYVRIQEAIDKKSILQDLKDEPKALGKIGLEVKQDESFYIK